MIPSPVVSVQAGSNLCFETLLEVLWDPNSQPTGLTIQLCPCLVWKMKTPTAISCKLTKNSCSCLSVHWPAKLMRLSNRKWQFTLAICLWTHWSLMETTTNHPPLLSQHIPTPTTPTHPIPTTLTHSYSPLCLTYPTFYHPLPHYSTTLLTPCHSKWASTIVLCPAMN